MCGIYGSNNLSTFEILNLANKERGNFATGLFYCYNKANYKIIRVPGAYDFDKNKLPSGPGWLYLGHNQAPTQTGRVFNEFSSHPFQEGDWVVAHNGVLTNFEELIDKYIPNHDIYVDSNIIPAMLAENEYKHGPCDDIESEIQNILFVLEQLRGTFALWIINIKTMNVYIARQGSTLYYKGGNISSTKGRHYREVKEGILYNFSLEGLTKVDTFINKSPFLTI